MDNYIINPMWFYWLHILNDAKSLIEITVICYFVVFAIAIMIAWFNETEYYDYDNNKESNFKKLVKRTRKFTIIAIIILVTSIFIPNKETMIEMKIAEFTTYENLDVVTEKIQNTADYIIEKMNEGK